MTRQLLHISVSPRGAGSHSRQVGANQVIRRQEAAGDLRIITRDLGELPAPHPGAAFMNASLKRDGERDAADDAALAYSEMLLAELAAADLVVIDTPMHNFTVPSTLKAWIDYVVRPGRSFGLSPRGKIPLLKDRPVRVAIACGGHFTGPFAQTDFLTPYLRYVFATIGIIDIDFLLLEQVIRNDSRALAARRADDWITSQVEQLGAVLPLRRRDGK